jgi:lipoate-protein ligase A
MEEMESMNRTPVAARRLPTEAALSYPGDAALAGPARDVSTTLSALYDGGFLESVEDLDLGLRVDVFEPARVAVVVGRSQDIGRVTNAGLAMADGVPVHRRRGGGGAVVLGPGMLVIAASGRSAGRFDVHTPFERVQGPIREVLADFGVEPRTAGTSDLALGARKILGSSLYQTRDRWSYQGVLLVRPDRRLFDRYLAYPDREPDYRRGRGHGAFTTSLADAGVLADLPALGRTIAEMIHRRVRDEARG